MTITPNELLRANVRHYAQANLFKDFGVHARCEGILHPRVLVDRKAQLERGFDALLYHESTHAAEYHAFVGVLILLMGLMTLAYGAAFGLVLGYALAPGWVGVWMLWRRHAEARADQVAYEGAGPSEFWLFVHKMTPPPRTWWAKWLYTSTRESRMERAWKRARVDV